MKVSLVKRWLILFCQSFRFVEKGQSVSVYFALHLKPHREILWVKRSVQRNRLCLTLFFSKARQSRYLKKTSVRILVTTSRSLRGHEDAFLLLLRRQRKERERREKERSSWWNMIPTWTIAYKNFPVLKTFRLCKPLIRLEFHTNSHGNWARIETPC